MIIQIILLILGFGILIKGASWLVDGGSALARNYKVSELAIGLTIVAFGTSMPELVVNVFAASESNHEIVFGNVIGSNIFNLLVILGIAGLITPLIVRSSTVWKEIPISLLAALILFGLANSFGPGKGTLSRLDGVILLFFFGLFLYYVFRQLKGDKEPSKIEHKKLSTSKIWIFIIIGLAFLIFGGQLVVTNAVSIAKSLGVSDTIIGLTIVAAGTSLPELATSIVAARKKNNDIAIGNVIGSNIFNIFFILGVSAVINPLEFNTKFNVDLYLLMMGTLLLFLAMFIAKKKQLIRWESGVLLSIYVAYVFYLIYNEAL